MVSFSMHSGLNIGATKSDTQTDHEQPTRGVIRLVLKKIIL